MHTSSPAVHRHSGRLGAAMFVVPFGALIATLVLSIAYAYVDVYSPVVGYVSVLFVVLFGFGLGWAVGKVGYLAKCRNTVLLRVTGLFSGLIALYVSWGAFEYALLARYNEEFTASLFQVLTSPLAIWEIAKSINVEGWYSVGSFTPAGGVLWAFWGIEAAIVVGAPFLLATMGIDDQVFCESCDSWCRTESSAVRLGLPESESHLAELRPENLQPLVSLPVAQPADDRFIRIDTWECERCRNTAAIQAKLAALIADKQGKVEEKTQDLTAIWNIPATVLQQIRSLGGPADPGTPGAAA